jgi:hypothetical protein
VVHNGIDTESFLVAPSDLRQKLGLEGKFLILGIVSGLGGTKGGKYFLELSEMLTVKTAEHNGRFRKYYSITKAGLKRIEEFKEEEDLVRIRAEIFCEKESHKGIIVGRGGEGLKRIGSYARADLEKMLDTKVYLNLWVKVKENWRDSARAVGNFGYQDE